MRAAVLVALCVCGAVRADERAAYAAAWLQFANAPDDTALRTKLVAGGETALEALVDILCGPERKPLDRTAVEGPVAQLGAPRFADREKAQRALFAMDAPVIRLLEPHRSHAEPEVRRRVAALIVALTPHTETRTQLDRLTGPATDILEQNFPLQQIQIVTRRNVRRLATLQSTNGHWSGRPQAPLFASLRMGDGHDRELLAKVLPEAGDGAADTILAVMRGGLSGQIPAHWRDPPRHDYRAAALAAMTPRRPTIFNQAMLTASGHPDLIKRLRAALDGQGSADVISSATWYLWYYHGDDKARDRLVQDLESEIDSRFERALDRLTDQQRSDAGSAVIPKLRPVLRGDNAARRLLALKRLKVYLWKPAVTLAADEAGRFLASPVAEERTAAETVLLDLQHGRSENVLRRVAEKGETAAVRDAATALEKRWVANGKP